MALAITAAACAPKAQINGTLEGAAEDNVIVKLLDVNKYVILDTVKTDKSGNYAYKLDVRKGDPEFIYIYYGDTKVASLILDAGDKVKVKSDIKGNYTVEGSEESNKLQTVETDYAAFTNKISGMTQTSDIALEYISYYRKSLKYVTENAQSLTVVPVMFQTLDGSTPIFSQQNDALRFRAIADSLLIAYPDSKFAKALDKEAVARLKVMELGNKLETAPEVNFPDLNLPDTKGQRVALSSLDSKVIFLYFWTSEMATQTVFNLDYLKPLYEEFHPKGLEIYAVCIDVDKALWAGIVKNQGLEWINVNDGMGSASPAVRQYNISSVPSLFVIEDGEMKINANEEKDLRSYLKRVLK